ncbi:related to SPO7 protein [Cephalotrichum gorgonifer]|uniref:Related to SPO7 protein n=1 Tax=Cephalotrichum gorgonifer TaxID=2041049 RepID=A0AAE8SSA9_9PEZI|nr:related to SPO7 protein [Cephalotrichum gorgonifer]
MSESIDSLVKGAPLPGVKSIGGTTPVTPAKEGDPLNHTPSSPSMIYLNLLILEASLRAQYLELRARRRHHTFFLSILTVWVAGFGYALFLAPREDGRGHGGSVYWGLEVAEQVCFMGGVITAILVWGTGIWDRGVKWPRRWFAISNRGLRGFNCKLVLIRRPWWAELVSTIGFFLTYGLFSHTASSSYRFVNPVILREVQKELNIGGSENHPALPIVVEDDERGGHEEDLAPGGDYVKLLLLPKYFTANFRENWDLYRTEYWEKENERRALLRKKLESRGREYAKQRWGIFWWLPWHQAEIDHYLGRGKTRHVHHQVRASSGGHGHGHHRSGSFRRGSVSSSRNPMSTVEMEDAAVMPRRPSSGSNTSEKARKRLSASRIHKWPDSRSVTPDFPSPLGKESTPGTPTGDAKTVRKSPSRGSVGSAKGMKRGEIRSEDREKGQEAVKGEKGVLADGPDKGEDARGA